METLSKRLSALQIATEELSEDWIDSNLDLRVPRKRPRQTLDETKADLKTNFLTPPTTFSVPWLNRLQQRFDVPVDYTDLLALAPTQSRTVTRFTREGLEGRVTGYREVTVPAGAATAKNSTSLLRKPASRAEFVRGKGGFLPFAPGGLDAIEAVANAEDVFLDRERDARGLKRSGKGLQRVINFGVEGGLLEVPPGFERGLDWTKVEAHERREKDAKDEKVGEQRASEVDQILQEEPEVSNEEEEQESGANGSANGNPLAGKDERDRGENEDDDNAIDSLLPVEFPALAARNTLLSSSKQRPGKQWAHMVDVKRPMPNFRELVPDMAREWPFELDTFQKEAVYHLENGDSVFVAAHTSAGKTVVAEYAIALAAKHMTKAIYTSPIKALSNQKFRDFQNEFADVGILTGDVQIRPEASCLIMTTEILRSMLYRGADLIRDVEYVIFDEVHYVNDLERGVVWEEVIIMLPEYVTLILLSATVPNTYEFASWVGRTKKKNIYVISTPKRPVPLQHYLWANKGMHMIVDAEKKFIEKGWKDANDILSGKDKIKAPAVGDQNARGGGRGQPQRGGQRGGQQQQRGGRGQPAQRGHGNIARTGRGGGRTSAAQDRTLWVHLVQHLKKEDLLPCCIFVFSKKRCEENADSLGNQDFCTASEKSAIHMTLEKSLARLRAEDRRLPQITRMRELLSRGVAVHHGGLLPIVKEVVEILFSKTLVKVLFATETFAMGLNLPTRTVVFSGYRKHDGRQFRDLLPGEYTQMAGRAGRRGLDKVGTVMIVAPGADEAPPATTLRQMILGEPTKLRSQFRLTYNMILNLLRVEALKIEEMIKRSFSENATQALLPEQERKMKLSEEDLAKIKRDPCDICDIDLEACHQACIDYELLTGDLHLSLLSSPIGRRMFSPRRLIVYQKDGMRTAGVLTNEGIGRGAAPVLQALSFGPSQILRKDADLLPYLPAFRPFFTPLPTDKSEIDLRAAAVALADVECVTQTFIKIDVAEVLKGSHEAISAAHDEFVPLCSDWTNASWDEADWGRVKDMTVQEIMGKRKKVATVAQAAKCLECPNFVKHFAQRHDEHLIQSNISALRQLMSDQNLQLLPDYGQRISVLEDLSFIDSGERVSLKGKVACEIHSADELVLTELILENALADFEPEEIVALLSAFVFQEKTEIEPTLTPALERGKATIIEISERVNAVQIQHQVIQSTTESNDFVSRPRFGLAEVVYEWARGMSFAQITDLTDVLEGTIVRVITRLDETCREVKNASRIIGDPGLWKKMEIAQECIRRDICAAASLYM